MTTDIERDPQRRYVAATGLSLSVSLLLLATSAIDDMTFLSKLEKKKNMP